MEGRSATRALVMSRSVACGTTTVVTRRRRNDGPIFRQPPSTLLLHPLASVRHRPCALRRPGGFGVSPHAHDNAPTIETTAARERENRTLQCGWEDECES
jgi:hypothetical protein